MAKKWHLQESIRHALHVKTVGPCPVCRGTAKVGEAWCVACSLTGKRDEYDKKRAARRTPSDG
jgi:hypothetical protein